MRLYEIKAASFSKFLEASTSDIERDLEQTAGQIKNASAFGQGDTTAAGPEAGDNLGAGDFGQGPEPMAGQSPLQQADNELEPDLPPGAEQTDDEIEELLQKKVDSILIAKTRGHPYIKNYRHEEGSKIHPYKILGMPLDELNQLRTKSRNKLNLETYDGDIGVYDNPDLKFFQDLVSFLDTVIESKKSSTKEYKDKKDGKTAKFDKREASKTKPGKVKKKVK